MKNFKYILSAVLGSAMLLTVQVNASVTIDDRTVQAFHTQIINASADKVWGLVSDLDHIEEIIPEVIKSTKVTGEGKGAVRICTDHEGNDFVEKILSFDDKSRRMVYAIEKGPMPVKNMVNTFQVISLSDIKSVLVISSRFDIPQKIENPEQVKMMMQGMITMSAMGFKSQIEL